MGLTSGATILLASGVIMNQEMYVVNDETMLAAGWLGLMYLFVKGGASGVAEALDERALEAAEGFFERSLALREHLDEWNDERCREFSEVAFCHMLCPTGYRAYADAPIATDKDGNQIVYEELFGWRLKNNEKT